MHVVLAFLKGMGHFKMHDYKIGVLLSAYNGEKYIAQQIESIMKQSNVEHITLLVRNDGSTDNTGLVLKKLEAKYPNMKVISGKNIGLIASFFKLLDIAVKEYDFDYYSFSDQDDYWMEDKLESAVKMLENEKNAFPLLYGCRSFIVDENLKPTGFLTQKKLKPISFYNTAIQNIIPGHNQVLNKKLAEILVNKKQDFTNIYSQDLWITNVAAISGKVLFENIPHTYYRMHGDNQLGYGKGKIDRIHAHLIRLRKKEPQKMALQLKKIMLTFDTFLSSDQKREMKLFFDSQTSLKKRFDYIRRAKLYRQSKKENCIFEILYLIGNYNI